MLGSCAARVVSLPSAQVPLAAERAADAGGERRDHEQSFGLLSLNGVPKKPQTTGAVGRRRDGRAGVDVGGDEVVVDVGRLRAGDVDVEDRRGERHRTSMRVVDDEARACRTTPGAAGRSTRRRHGRRVLARVRQGRGEKGDCAPALPASTKRSRALAIFSMAASRWVTSGAGARGLRNLRSRSGLVDCRRRACEALANGAPRSSSGGARARPAGVDDEARRGRHAARRIERAGRPPAALARSCFASSSKLM